MHFADKTSAYDEAVRRRLNAESVSQAKGEPLLNDPVVAASTGGLFAGSAGSAGGPDVEQGGTARERIPSGAIVRQLGLRALPWLLALGVATITLMQMGTPILDIGRYAGYWCLGVTLPGVLVLRAAIGSRGNWPEDIALGAVTGLALELLCFALWSVLGQQQQLWLWPLLVLGIFAAVPRLRLHWRIGSPQALPQLWSWGVASAVVVSTVIVRETAFANPLPPAGGAYDQDAAWHLSIVHELARSFPPQIPQVSGEVLRYHWFSHVHLAASHLMSGAPEATVFLRLSIIPLLAVTALIGARLAVELSGRWWSGPVAAWCLIVFEGTDLLLEQGDASVIFASSPSQIYVLPIVLGACTLIVRALRGQRLRAGWAVLALMLAAAAGAKPTALPLLLAGACFAGLALLIQRRREWLAALWVVGMVAVILPVSVLFVEGSDGGSSKISLFDFVEWNPLYHQLTGAPFQPSGGPFLPEGVSDLSSRSLVILALLLLVPLVANLARLAPFALLGSGQLRTDPAAWFLAGVAVAGWGVYLTLAHPAYSQAYFLRLANPVASVFGAWALASVVPRGPGLWRSGRRVATVLAGGTMIGVVTVAVARAVTPPLPAAPATPMQPAGIETLNAVLPIFAAPLGVVGAAVVAGLLWWRLLRTRVPSLRGWGLSLVLAALVLGGPAHGAIATSGSALVDFVTDRPVVKLISDRHVPKGGGYRITPGGAAAMAWVEQHTPQDAVIATNRHCIIGRQRPGCFTLSFWVSGLGGRRTVLEGWGYTSAAGGGNAPSPFPGRLAVNDAVFTEPSARTIDRLRRDYGATWLVADRSAGPVSGQLAHFAVPRFSSGEVTVYELR